MPSIVIKKKYEVPFCLKWYYKVYDGLRKNLFKSLEKEVNQLKDDEKLSNLLQGIEVAYNQFDLIFLTK